MYIFNPALVFNYWELKLNTLITYIKYHSKAWDDVFSLPIVSEKRVNFDVVVVRFECGHIDQLTELISFPTEQTGVNHGRPAVLKMTLTTASVVLKQIRSRVQLFGSMHVKFFEVVQISVHFWVVTGLRLALFSPVFPRAPS